MKKKALFIVNPYSGKGLIRDNLLDIIDILVKADYQVMVHTTQRQGEAIEISKERDKDLDLIVCSGGDGTLDEIVTGMIKSGFNTTIGYIPAGSTNDFANSLGISSDMSEAARTVVNGEAFPCDMGLFNDDVFVYVAAFGIMTEVSYVTPQQMKNVFGHAAYIIEGVKHLQNINSFHAKVTYEEGVIEEDFIYGMVTNSRSIGGMKGLARCKEGVELNDGWFEVMLIKMPRNPVELNMILAALVNENINVDYMYNFRTKSMIVESDKEIPWTLDGEFGGSHTRVEIKNLHKAVEIMI